MLREELNISGLHTSRLDLVFILLSYGFPFIDGISLGQKALPSGEVLSLLARDWKRLLALPQNFDVVRKGNAWRICFTRCSAPTAPES